MNESVDLEWVVINFMYTLVELSLATEDFVCDFDEDEYILRMTHGE